MKRRAIKIFAALAVVMQVAGCELRDLYREDVTPVPVVVEMNWDALGGAPSGASIYFYPESGGECLLFRTNNTERYEASVPAGYYNIMVFNRSTEEFGTLYFRDMGNFGSAAAHIYEQKFTWPESGDTVGKTVMEPERIVSGVVTRFQVRNLTVKSAKNGSKNDIRDTVRIKTRRLTYDGTVAVRINGINNLKYERGYVTGFAGGVGLAMRTGLDTATFVPVSWSVSTDEGDYTKGWLTGKFSCLGLPESSKSCLRAENNRLVLEFLLVDNKTVISRCFDVGNMIMQDEANFIVTVSINTEITLPDVKPEVGKDTGFDVHVDDWGEPTVIEI